MEYLFVYGLFRDSGNPLLGEDKEYLGKDYITGTLYKVNEFYPGFVRKGSYKTWGDVYKIDPKIFPELDEYEGEEYNRTKIKTSSGYECWVYEYKEKVDNKPVIKTGDWMLR